MQSISYYLKHRDVLVAVIMAKCMWWLPDKAFIKIKFRTSMGYKLNLDNPQTINEKLQWIKLYDHRPEYTMMVDKVKVKDYVASLIGSQFVIPTLGVWNDPNKIDFDLLPNRFVLKCNHNSGLGLYICRDKTRMDANKVKKELHKGLKQNYYRGSREWPYKNVPRRILAEAYIDSSPNVSDLPKYRWYCFEGEPRFCQVIQNRNECETFDFFDSSWNLHNDMDFDLKARNAEVTPVCPDHLDYHLRIARDLCRGFSFSRIDLYETGENSFFGKVASYSTSDFVDFRPDQYDYLLKQMIKAPVESQGEFTIWETGNKRLEVLPLGLQDYKFYCFNGEPKMVMVSNGRFTEKMTFDYYTTDWQKIDMTWGARNSDKVADRPANFELMLELSRRLSAGLPHVRVDMYNVQGVLYFGELTFFDSSGFERIEPIEWDYKLGEWIDLPKER